MSQIRGHRPPVAPPPQLPPPPLQRAKLISNCVNVYKDTIKLQLDDLHPDCHLVTFTFDAYVNGSITIFYFAEEGDKCNFTPIYRDIIPVKVQFQKGLGQKFCQLSGTGVDLNFFMIDDLSNPSPGEHVYSYPLVISAHSSTNNNAHISQAVVLAEKKDGRDFQVKVVKQILWADGVRYELHDVYGVSDLESEKECIICFTKDKNTVVLPCRHMCMCCECAKNLRLESNKCPLCRQTIEELMLMEIKLRSDQIGVSRNEHDTYSSGYVQLVL